jgi:hypothetical protein
MQIWAFLARRGKGGAERLAGKNRGAVESTLIVLSWILLKRFKN